MNKSIVILGAGFAGLQAARRLKDSGYEIVLIDQYNFHQFQPLFYQVATGSLEPSAISFPLRKVFQREKKVHVRIAKVNEIDYGTRKVKTTEGDFNYDYLVIATGCTSNFFGNKNFERYVFPMKSTNEAVALRNRILLNFEDALSARPEEMEEIMNLVIAGGGPTGVELAGALAEMKRNILPRDYPDMDFSGLQIFLVEGGSHTLQNMSEASQLSSQRYLEKMGVQLRLNTLVQDYDGKVITLTNGSKIKTRNLIWTAGVMGSLPEGLPQECVARGNRIKVDEYNRVIGLTDVFAIGDIAYMETTSFPKGHPQLANVAINQAKNLVVNFRRLQDDKPLQPFEYKNPG
jgi:NADH dehydrogenase